MAYGNNKMNTQAPMPMRPGIGALPKAGGMNPMATGGMGPMTNRGVNPMQGGLMQGLAAQGRGGDTELAHVNPVEANILKSLGGSGTINPNTGLREYSWLSEGLDYLFGGQASKDVSGAYESMDESIFQGWLPGGYDAPTWRDITQMWGQHLGMPVGQDDDGLYWGDYPGSDPDYIGGLQAESRFGDYLASTQTRAEQLRGQKNRNMGGLLAQASSDYRPAKEQYSRGVGSMNVSDAGEAFGPINPLKAHIRGVRESEFGINKQYSEDRYGLLSSTRDAYNDYINNLISPEFRADAESYDVMTADMPWLKEPKTNTT